MDTQLLTLSKIFTERLFRIPDYQRGYAWTEKHLVEFWNDVEQLEPGRNHYIGVLTLEDVPGAICAEWDDDLWIVDAKNYSPYFVVDGQQRLTTAIVLIQAILERIGENETLNFTARTDIQRKFIFDSKDGGISRSYIFGYEKDNPSYEYLKTQIFCERSSSCTSQETVYTQNLARAKTFFQERLEKLPTEELQILYRKVTQHLLFNIFTITDDVDVCVAFETMNNRGKPLSYLELLKNRLIYLSLKFDQPDYEKKKLRNSINDCWKAIYHNLGRNREKPLDDDNFLLTHYIIYFGKTIFPDGALDDWRRIRRLYREDFATDLLENRFVSKNILRGGIDKDGNTESVTLATTYGYVSSLQEAVETWYRMWNPSDSGYELDTQIWLDKLNRLEMQTCAPLILVFLQQVADEKKRVLFLQVLEKHLFVTSLVTRYYSPYPYSLNLKILQMAIDLRAKKLSAEKITKQISDATSDLLRDKDFSRNVTAKFRQDGFYSWSGVRYFLFEYNIHLQEKSKTDRPKIFWPEFQEQKRDYVSIEHIYPQRALHNYWKTRFDGLTQKQRTALRNSLGNLLPLSKPKNSSLSNKPFPEKVEGNTDSRIGYRYGSYAENELAKTSEWTPNEIVSRGLKLLDFLERRWTVEFGDENKKKQILGVEFVK
jgi:uncharacterized protein with ParB-like and HNH nuclease domain